MNGETIQVGLFGIFQCMNDEGRGLAFRRIGEVAARFTLDALPGKQISIDADLNAGIINAGLLIFSDRCSL